MEDNTQGAGQEQITDEGQAAAKTKLFTQEELNAIVAKERSKVAKKYEDLGDPDEIRTLRQREAKAQEEAALKRGEWDQVRQKIIADKDQEIQKRDIKLRNFMIDTPLVQAAAEFKSVNPDQVRALLKERVKINDETGEAEVIDQKGATQYDDKGVPLKVKDLVKQFLDSNPHFVLPNPAGTNGRNSLGAGSKDVDVSKMGDDEYRAYRKAHPEQFRA